MIGLFCDLVWIFIFSSQEEGSTVFHQSVYLSPVLLLPMFWMRIEFPSGNAVCINVNTEYQKIVGSSELKAEIGRHSRKQYYFLVCFHDCIHRQRLHINMLILVRVVWRKLYNFCYWMKERNQSEIPLKKNMRATTAKIKRSGPNPIFYWFFIYTQLYRSRILIYVFIIIIYS